MCMQDPIRQAAASGKPVAAVHGKSANVSSHDRTDRQPISLFSRLQCGIFAPSTSTCSICGGSASNSDALAISAAAIGPAKCALRPVSSAKASKMPNVAGPIRARRL